jgi:anti-sigma B factor antagonist
MKYSIDKQEQYALLKPDEENLNSLIAPSLKSELIILHNEGISNLILDLSNVEYVDSSGLSAILTGNRLFANQNAGSFVLTGVEHPNVKRLIEISRLDTVITIIPTASEAVDYVFMEVMERELNEEGEGGEDGE